MAELTPEDALRLNVLLASDVQAIRVDATNMTIFGLTPRGVATIKLHPVGRNDQYLKTAKELLAAHAIGSPQGYPAYVQHWSRMGQARDKGLDRLLLLGDPDAVMSVAYSAGLTAELARRAWWVHPVADHARGMLERECVASAEIGKVLADFLLEHLPFEQEPQVIIRTVRVLLQPGLTSETDRLTIWRKGALDNAYQVGYLAQLPEEIPEPLLARDDYDKYASALMQLSEQGNVFAKNLARVLSSSGQTFLNAYDKLLRYPADQDVVLVLLEAMASYFSGLRKYHPCTGTTVEEVITSVEALITGQPETSDMIVLLRKLPELAPEMTAMLTLSCIDANIATPILAQTTATGSLMRQKLEPVFNPILKLIATLMAREFTGSVARRRARGV